MMRRGWVGELEDMVEGFEDMVEGLSLRPLEWGDIYWFAVRWEK